MALLTSTTWKYLTKGYEFSCRFHFHPFIWDEGRKRPELITSGWQLLPWYFNAAATFLYYGFVVFRAVQTKLDPRAGAAEKIYMQFNLAYFMFPVIFQSQILRNRKEFVAFVQRYLVFLQRFEEDLLSGSRPLKWSKLCGAIHAMVYYSFYLNEFLVVCCSYFRPQSPELLSSLLPHPEELVWYARIPFVLWHLYFMTGFVEAALMYIFCSVSFIAPAMDIVEYISKPQAQGQSRQRMGNGGNMENSLKIYVQIQRFVAEFNGSMGPVFQGTKVLLVFLAIFCTYGGIRFDGLLAVCLGWIGISTTTFLVIQLACLGEFHNKSKKLLLLWQRQAADVGLKRGCEALWLRRQVRSLSTIQIRFGSLYHIDKAIVLTCFKTIFDAVTNFLVLNK